MCGAKVLAKVGIMAGFGAAKDLELYMRRRW
jgi:hypothetical protein